MRPCLERKCPELVTNGYCLTHARARSKIRMARPGRWVYDDRRWPHCRDRALHRAGYQCEATWDRVRCTATADLHGHHTPLSVVELLEQGLDPFDDRRVVVACEVCHGRIEALLRAR